MRLFFIVLFLITSTLPALSQGNDYIVKGSLQDTLNLQPLQYSSISLMQAKDSILIAHTRADKDGNFLLKIQKPGDYLMLVAHPLFAHWIDKIRIETELTDLGDIHMISKRYLLEEVVIKDRQAIMIKGDTVEYSADSFKVREFDNVDELLKRLPGIEVDRDGSIKAYGTKVQKMLVDGEEFFSEDPAVVAKMLRASSIDKVQVFDKKSEQAEFTGIDDGEKIKTINLTLKEDAKKGYMGKVTAGAGLPRYWENEAMINSFKNKRKISAFGVFSNTNTTGLDWQDATTYGGGGSSFVSDGGDFVTTFSSGGDNEMGWGGQFNGQGLPHTLNGGLHFANKWWEDKLSLNASYRYANNGIESAENTIRQYILPDTQYYNNRNSSGSRNSQRHGLTSFTEFKIDSSSSVQLRLNSSIGVTDNSRLETSESINEQGEAINRSEREQYNSSENKNISADLNYRKRFKKEGRSLIMSANINYDQRLSNGELVSQNDLIAIDSLWEIDQYKHGHSQNLKTGARLNYTEPLVKGLFMVLNYRLQINNEEAENLSYDRDVPNQDSVFNPLFSSHYAYNIMINRGGLALRYQKDKFNFNMGTDIGSTLFNQNDLMNDTVVSYNNINYFPYASMRYSIRKQTSLSFNYNGNTRQPSLSQVQPFRVNNDPMNISIGNPNLKQEVSHRFSLSYNSYGVLSGRNIYLNGSISFRQNAITESQFIDEVGRRTYQYVNLDGGVNGSLYANYGFKIKQLPNLRPSLGMNGSMGKTPNFINNIRNVNTQMRWSPSVKLSYNQDTTFRIYFSFNPSYNTNHSSVRKDVRTQYWIFNQSLEGSVNLPYNFVLGSTLDWNIRQRVVSSERNNNILQWNAYVSRHFLKDKSLVAKIYAFDILNRNVGYTRFESADMITENTFNRIQRYFMFSLSWNFTRTGSSNIESPRD